jgi:hypothetical protein
MSPKKVKKNTIAPALAEAALLEEAADTKLRAAEKLGRANALLAEDEAPEPERTPRFTDPSDLEPMPGGESPLSNFEAALAELNGHGRFEVFKLSKSGKRVKVGAWSLDEYPEQMDRIAEQQGGGTFRIFLRNERGEYVVSTTEEYDTTAYAPETPANAPAAASGILDRVLERMDNATADHRREMEALRAENQKMLLMMMDKLSQPRQETNFLDAVKLVKELSGEARSPMDSFREVLELAQSVKEETGLSEPEHPMVAAIDKVMKVASPLLSAWATKLAHPTETSRRDATAKALPASTGAAPVVRADSPAPAPAPVIVPAVSPAVAALNAELDAPVAAAVVIPTPAPASATIAIDDPRLKQYAMSLLAQATAGADANNIGDAIISMTHDDDLDELYKMVSDKGFVGLLMAAEPALAKHEAWLQALSSHIVIELADDSQGAVIDAAPEEVAA